MKIYPLLLRIWAALLVSALQSLTALSTNYMLLMAANIANLLCYGVLVHALYRMAGRIRPPAARIPHPVRGARAGRAGARMHPAGRGQPDAAQFPVAADGRSAASQPAGRLFSVLGLDERILPCGYAFPARRIRWCLYAPVLGSFIGSLFVLTGPLLLTVALPDRRPAGRGVAALAVHAGRPRAGGRPRWPIDPHTADKKRAAAGFSACGGAFVRYPARELRLPVLFHPDQPGDGRQLLLEGGHRPLMSVGGELDMKADEIGIVLRAG